VADFRASPGRGLGIRESIEFGIGMCDGCRNETAMACEPMTTKAKRAAISIRVSTDGQTTENQRMALEAVAAQRGWTIAAIYDDAGISGAKGRDKRPGLDKLLTDAARARFDVVMAWAMDRLGRSLAGLIDTLKTLEAANVDLFLHQQTIDTTTPAGRTFFHVTGAFAEFERDMIRSRVNAGLDRARARGVRLGRPTVKAKVENAVRDRLMAGDGMVKIAKALGIGVSTVQRMRNGMQKAGPH
jgi:DNA invertase Pin-like site-specific DNA recombinase